MKKERVKINKKGHLVLEMSKNQYLEFLEFLDELPSYQKNSQYTPLQRVWNIVLQKLKERFLIAPVLLEDSMKVLIKMEEAVILNELFYRFHTEPLLIEAIMMDINQKIISHA